MGTKNGQASVAAPWALIRNCKSSAQKTCSLPAPGGLGFMAPRKPRDIKGMMMIRTGPEWVVEIEVTAVIPD